MIYNCKRLYKDSGHDLTLDSGLPLELTLRDRVLNATLEHIHYNPIYNDLVLSINEPGSEPILYEGLEFDMWCLGKRLGKFKVL